MERKDSLQNTGPKDSSEGTDLVGNPLWGTEMNILNDVGDGLEICFALLLHRAKILNELRGHPNELKLCMEPDIMHICRLINKRMKKNFVNGNKIIIGLSDKYQGSEYMKALSTFLFHLQSIYDLLLAVEAESDGGNNQSLALLVIEIGWLEQTLDFHEIKK